MRGCHGLSEMHWPRIKNRRLRIYCYIVPIYHFLAINELVKISNLRNFEKIKHKFCTYTSTCWNCGIHRFSFWETHTWLINESKALKAWTSSHSNETLVQGVDYEINPACFQGKATVVLTRRSCGSASGWGSRSPYWSPLLCATSPVRNAGNGTRATTLPDGRCRRPRGPPGPSHHRHLASFSARPRREVNRGRTISPYNAEIWWLISCFRLEQADVSPWTRNRTTTLLSFHFFHLFSPYSSLSFLFLLLLYPSTSLVPLNKHKKKIWKIDHCAPVNLRESSIARKKYFRNYVDDKSTLFYQ